MKLILSLSEIHDTILQLAKEYNETFVHAEVKMNQDKKITIRAYINGFATWAEADTLQGVIDILRRAKGEVSESKITDVEFDLTKAEMVEEEQI